MVWRVKQCLGIDSLTDFLEGISSNDISNACPFSPEGRKVELRLRKDVVLEKNERDEIQKNNKFVHKGYYKVPKIIE